MNTTSNAADLTVYYNRLSNLLFSYGFLVELVMCSIGSVLGCIVFCQKAMRENSAAIYFIVFYIANFLFSILSWMPASIQRIINYSWTGHSVYFCKIYNFFNYTFPAISRYCIVFAAINRTLTTSSNASMRRRITHLFAYQTIIGIVLLVESYYVFVFVDVNIHQSGAGQPVCTSAPGIYSYLVPITPIVINTCIPLLLMAVFAIQTLKNLHRKRVQPTNTNVTSTNTQQERDRQFTVLVLVEVAVYVLFAPWSPIFSAYQRSTQTTYKTAQQQALVQLVSSILAIANYVPPTISFYQNFILSKAFRQKTKALFFKRCRLRPADGSSRHENVRRTANQSNLQWLNNIHR